MLNHELSGAIVQCVWEHCQWFHLFEVVLDVLYIVLLAMYTGQMMDTTIAGSLSFVHCEDGAHCTANSSKVALLLAMICLTVKLVIDELVQFLQCVQVPSSCQHFGFYLTI